MLSLVIGGARSGKSRYAQSLCSAGNRVVYLATARAEDPEMSARIERHRAARPAHWLTVEEPLEISSAVEHHAAVSDYILVDCLTLWLSNLCWQQRDAAPEAVENYAFREIARFIASSAAGHVVAVTNEVGSGIVPETPLGRFFRDLHGLINQEAARSADWVYHMVAGIAVTIKQPGGAR